MKNKIIEAIDSLKEKFPEVNKLLKYDIEVETDKENEVCLAGIEMTKNKFVLNEIVVEDTPILNYCLVFNARLSSYINKIEPIECESKKFLMMVAANFKINDELQEFVSDDFKIHKDACLDKNYECKSFEDILADVTVKYSYLAEQEVAEN